eukprot:gene32432-42019_t
MSTPPIQQEEAEMASDKDIVVSGGISVDAFLQMSAQSRQAVINISAKLEDKQDSSVVVDLFQYLPNYSKIKEELEVKFATYKSELERDRMSCDVQHAKTVNELKLQNSLLQNVNEELKSMNKILIDKFDAMEVRMKEDRVVTAMLRTKLEDMEFQNCISDVFRFMRDGIIAKQTSTDFPKGVSALPLLKYPKDLESDDEEDEDKDEDDTMTDEERTKSAEEKEAALTTARDGHLKASTFIESIGLDPSLVLDMYKLNKNHNDDTHDDDWRLKITKKVTNPHNLKALGEIQASLLKLHEGNAAFHVKDRLLQWVTVSISAAATVPNAKTGKK